jgi:hypothetical protein
VRKRTSYPSVSKSYNEITAKEMDREDVIRYCSSAGRSVDGYVSGNTRDVCDIFESCGWSAWRFDPGDR